VARYFGFLLTPEPPAKRVGALLAVVLVALCTIAIYPLKQVAPVVSLGVVYMLAVVIVSVTWGVWLGVGTSLLSALAFNYFHLPPVGRLRIRDLPTAAARLSALLELPSAAIELESVEGDERRVAFPLREGPRRLGTLLVPADTSEATLRRLQERIVPSLESLLTRAWSASRHQADRPAGPQPARCLDGR
jgi:two-component system, OmpR family, sensor histidine kinase KdpD